MQLPMCSIKLLIGVTYISFVNNTLKFIHRKYVDMSIMGKKTVGPRRSYIL